jgi:hypothetical protein
MLQQKAGEICVPTKVHACPRQPDRQSSICQATGLEKESPRSWKAYHNPAAICTQSWCAHKSTRMPLESRNDRADICSRRPNQTSQAAKSLCPKRTVSCRHTKHKASIPSQNRPKGNYHSLKRFHSTTPFIIVKLPSGLSRPSNHPRTRPKAPSPHPPSPSLPQPHSPPSPLPPY